MSFRGAIARVVFAFSFAIAFCLAGATSAFAAAEDYTVVLGGVQVTNANAEDVLDDGTVRVVFNDAGPTADVYLSNATLECVEVGDAGDAAAIYSEDVPLAIHLLSDNRIVMGRSDGDVEHIQGICTSEADVTISGPGSLSVELVDSRSTEGGDICGAHIGGDLRIIGNAAIDISCTCSGTAPVRSYGLHAAEGSVIVDQATLTVQTCAATIESIPCCADLGAQASDATVSLQAAEAEFSCGLKVYEGDVIIDGFSQVTAIADTAVHESIGVNIWTVGEYGVCVRDGAMLTAIGAEEAEAGFGIYSDLVTVQSVSFVKVLGSLRAISGELDLTGHAMGDAYVNLDYDDDATHAEPWDNITPIATEDSYYRFVQIPGTPHIERLAGDTASETSVAIAKATVETNGFAVIARDDDFADALGATGLAGSVDAPILLTDRNELSPAVRQAIDDLRITRIYLIGGPGAISQELEDELNSLPYTVWVRRLWGETSYDTSLACARELQKRDGSKTEAIVAMSTNFQDALSASPIAYRYGMPVILQTWGDTSDERGFTDEARAFLADRELIVAGGPGAISDASLEGLTVKKRLWGDTGYDTSNEIAKWATDEGLLDVRRVVVACGAQAPKGVDALAGAALAGTLGAPILLANANDAMEPVDLTTIDGFLSDNVKSIRHAYVLGGTYVAPQDLYERIRELIVG